MSLQIDEQVAPGGHLVSISLRSEGTHFSLLRGQQPIGKLSGQVIANVVARYARPLETAPSDLSDPLILGDQVSLHSWRYRAPVDLEAKLYLLLYRQEQEPVAVLSRQVASALCFLCGER